MNIIIPLAGPDFISPSGRLKSLMRYREDYLTRYIINSRPWFNDKIKHDLVFILVDSKQIRDFVESYLLKWFPKSKVIYLSNCTQGAALTSLIACGMFDDPSLPLCIDLADIDYETDLDPTIFFDENQSSSAIAITFNSDNPQYSYFLLDEFANFLYAKEKDVIATNDSAGTYLFRNTSVYLDAMSQYLCTSRKKLKNNLFYVAPIYNFIRDANRAVRIYKCQLIKDVKCI